MHNKSKTVGLNINQDAYSQNCSWSRRAPQYSPRLCSFLPFRSVPQSVASFIYPNKFLSLERTFDQFIKKSQTDIPACLIRCFADDLSHLVSTDKTSTSIMTPKELGFSEMGCTDTCKGHAAPLFLQDGQTKRIYVYMCKFARDTKS
jgi:hypothetical protein